MSLSVCDLYIDKCKKLQQVVKHKKGGYSTVVAAPWKLCAEETDIIPQAPISLPLQPSSIISKATVWLYCGIKRTFGT